MFPTRLTELQMEMKMGNENRELEQNSQLIKNELKQFNSNIEQRRTGSILRFVFCFIILQFNTMATTAIFFRGRNIDFTIFTLQFPATALLVYLRGFSTVFMRGRRHKKP